MDESKFYTMAILFPHIKLRVQSQFFLIRLLKLNLFIWILRIYPNKITLQLSRPFFLTNKYILSPNQFLLLSQLPISQFLRFYARSTTSAQLVHQGLSYLQSCYILIGVHKLRFLQHLLSRPFIIKNKYLPLQDLLRLGIWLHKIGNIKVIYFLILPFLLNLLYI